MKVIINTCHGGFGWSVDAIKLAISLGSQSVRAQDNKRELGSEWRDVGDGYRQYSSRGKLYKEGKMYAIEDSITARTDPILVKIAEDLGQSANGRYAELKVVDIPDGVDWYIDWRDGMEHVAEKHRTWR